MTTNPPPSEAQLNDPEGRRLVQAIHDRKTASTGPLDHLVLIAQAYKADEEANPERTEILAALRSQIAWSLDADQAMRKVAESLVPVLQQAKAQAWDEGHEEGFWNGRLSAGMLPSEPGQMPLIGKEHAEAKNPYREAAKEDREQDQLRRIPTYPNCATCDGGGCGDCA